MRRLHILSAAGCVTVQDRGRPGYLAQGLSRGGAVDPVALAEGAALLRQSPDLAVIEMMAAPLRLRADQPTRIALTGAPMRAELRANGQQRALDWHGSHLIPGGAELALSPGAGGFSYLTPAGGIAGPERMGARSAHLAGGIGRVLQRGDSLPLGDDQGGPVDLLIAALPRFNGGELRAVESLQTALFAPEEIARLQATPLHRDRHGNRMGLRLDMGQAPPFHAERALTAVSEIVQPGDVQITGSGAPFLLLAECQTTGGYPRIATVLPCDLPIAAQAAPGVALRLRLVTRATALDALHAAAEALTPAALARRIQPRLRDPAQMGDLLAHNLIGGMVDAARPDHMDHALDAPTKGAIP